ncbi:hypothetical protein BDV32DRAFT_131457 [Aspergillus pseudonomiae]|nr:hypothetical protein BDV32DRAFT_131457 [Aspergillus pseudonomiae]
MFQFQSARVKYDRSLRGLCTLAGSSVRICMCSVQCRGFMRCIRVVGVVLCSVL